MHALSRWWVDYPLTVLEKSIVQLSGTGRFSWWAINFSTSLAQWARAQAYRLPTKLKKVNYNLIRTSKIWELLVWRASWNSIFFNPLNSVDPKGLVNNWISQIFLFMLFSELYYSCVLHFQLLWTRLSNGAQDRFLSWKGKNQNRRIVLCQQLLPFLIVVKKSRYPFWLIKLTLACIINCQALIIT